MVMNCEERESEGPWPIIKVLFQLEWVDNQNIDWVNRCLNQTSDPELLDLREAVVITQ